MAEVNPVVARIKGSTQMLLRHLVTEFGLAAVLDALGDEFPQYANDLHEIVERVEFDARRLRR